LAVIDGASTIGGGSAPGSALPTRLVALAADDVSASTLEARLRAGDGVHLDQQLVDDALALALAAHGRDLHIVSAQAVLVSDAEVQVVLVATVDYVFVRAVPGAAHEATVTVRVTAVAA